MIDVTVIFRVRQFFGESGQADARMEAVRLGCKFNSKHVCYFDERASVRCKSKL